MAEPMSLRPGEFCRFALRALEASEGQSRRRKRDQRPDQIGLAIKRELLLRAAEEDPEPQAFEAWLATQALAAPASGPVRAMALQILDEYRFAALDPGLRAWLRAGAPSDDAGPERPRPGDERGCGCPGAMLGAHGVAHWDPGWGLSDSSHAPRATPRGSMAGT